MGDTKEKILLTSLRLFALKGFDAVSVSDIAAELGITKGALYKHYTNKRSIFDSIVERMERLDSENAREYGLPEKALSESEEEYRAVSISQTIEFARAMFRYWTEENFPSAFRKMLTLEQYKSEEMRQKYQQYLVGGPLGYLADIFASIGEPNAEEMAVKLYAPMFFFYSLYDCSDDKRAVSAAFEAHLNTLSEAWKISEKINTEKDDAI